MGEKSQYWAPMHMCGEASALLDMRCQKAWELLSRHGLITGVASGEDSAGRAVIAPMPPEEVVARCFAMADAFVDTAEARGGVRRVSPEENTAALARFGELEGVKNRHARVAEHARLVELLDEKLDELSKKS